jgi:DNA/RNA-binding domain of Phe-tRNA-synthetase-like protein
MTIPFSISENYQVRYPGLAFGFALISNCQNPMNPPNFDEYKRALLRKMRKRETLSGVTERINFYDRFFLSFGYECPLPKHLKRTVHSGFPRYNLMVDTHFMAEMCAGILVAVTDYDRFDGALTLDIAHEGEICQGMGERKLITRQDEIVLRDELEIVCVLCQGADEKTRINQNTSRVLFYAYTVPGVEPRYLKEGLDLAAETMARFGQGTVETVTIF